MSTFHKTHTLTHLLNTKTNKLIRWCTPSIEPSAARVINHYESDISISYQSLGFPFEPSGVFKRAYEKAAKAYGADYTLFSVNGSTGSNFIVLRSLSKQIPNLRILSQRNVHKSVICAAEDYNISLLFLPPNVDEKLQIFLPNTVNKILYMIERVKPHVLLLTNPTYEGVTLDLKTLIAKIRKKYPQLIVYIEEAWGAHLHFSSKLPISAMSAGADICIQSTHKQGGALQQSGMIHWKKNRIDKAILEDSFKSLSTSSPSFILLGSLDAARDMMEKHGKHKIDRVLHIAKELSNKLSAIEGFRVIRLNELKKRSSAVFDKDATKVLVEIEQPYLSGFTIAKLLEEKYNIILEKYNINSLLFLVPLQATLEQVDLTIKALREIIAMQSKQLKKDTLPLVRMPRTIRKILEIGEVAKLLQDQIERIPLKKAQGRIAAENITIYPPGIPTTLKGEEFTQEMVDYYRKLRTLSNCHILAQDLTLETVAVVK